MTLQKHLPIYIVIIISFASCYSPFQQDTLHDPGYDDGGKLKNVTIKQSNNVLGLNRLDDSNAAETVSVDCFGAKGDGSTDDSEAFEKAWEAACSSDGAVLVVPANKNYLLKPIRLSGPCKSDLTVQISGTLIASNDRSDYSKDSKYWLVFEDVQDLLVEGAGTIDGNGKIWWENSCKINKNHALTFQKSQNLTVRNLKIQNAQQMHVTFHGCTGVQVSGLKVTAPGDSPNTDGIHVTHTEDIQISSCNIGTGDDCISIVSGSKNVQASDITCGPGHGISIGSLGAGKSTAYVSGVTVNGAKLSGTTNGVRIKTWQGGSGNASNIKFLNIEMNNVTNPIIIDQNYCDKDEPCKQERSAVQIEDVVYQNITGTSASDVAVKLDCSKSYPCQRIVMQNVKLQKEGGEAVKVERNNVNVTDLGIITGNHQPEMSRAGLKSYLQILFIIGPLFLLF
ncbi:Polygalacturonase [Quillaja saponaria]|uniref:endo-polygalacturonase n=1 Tax=Quillaja saponaria TaxID=32244 RepID=A0AAD7PZS9_QUISA|nr:Polygalacturonase [Quillaja saponaria]